VGKPGYDQAQMVPIAFSSSVRHIYSAASLPEATISGSCADSSLSPEE